MQNVTDNVEQHHDVPSKLRYLTAWQFRFMMAIGNRPMRYGPAIQEDIELTSGALTPRQFYDISKSLLDRGLVTKEKHEHSSTNIYRLTVAGRSACDLYWGKPSLQSGLPVSNPQAMQ